MYNPASELLVSDGLAGYLALLALVVLAGETARKVKYQLGWDMASKWSFDLPLYKFLGHSG